MLIRLRSRDGLERLAVPEGATVAQLRHQISDSLSIPETDVVLSKDKDLLTAKDKGTFTDMLRARSTLHSLGIGHGDLVYMHYPFEREVASSVRKSVFDGRRFGSKMTVDDLLAKQTRIERQETPHCSSVSFDRHAANAFQSYLHQALAFSIKRGGLLYGTVDDEGHISVHAIYEPPQEGSADVLKLERGTEEEMRADYIAGILGWKKVGWIFSQSVGDRDYIMSGTEVSQMAAIQEELGDTAVTGVVSISSGDDSADVHFEAFQVSDQCVRLHQAGWFQSQAEPSGILTLRNPEEPDKKDPVIVAGKDVGDVDVDYFLIPINIRDHEGPLTTGFPLENRLLPQGPAELRAHLQKAASKPYTQRISDFHLLLYLSRQPNLDLANDMSVIIEAVKHRAVLPEGYTLIIDSLAAGM